MSNPSGIIPTEYNVLVRPKEVEQKTKGGIILPDEHRDREQHGSMEGELIAVSPLAFQFDNWPADAKTPEVGEHVLFSRHAGIIRDGADGKSYRIIKDKDVAATLEEARDG